MSKKKGGQKPTTKDQYISVRTYLRVAQGKPSSLSYFDAARAAERFARWARSEAKKMEEKENQQKAEQERITRLTASFRASCNDEEWAKASTLVNEISATHSTIGQGLWEELVGKIRLWLDDLVSFSKSNVDANTMLVFVAAKPPFTNVMVSYRPAGNYDQPAVAAEYSHSIGNASIFKFKPNRDLAPYEVEIRVEGENLPTVLRNKTLSAEQIPEPPAPIPESAIQTTADGNLPQVVASELAAGEALPAVPPKSAPIQTATPAPLSTDPLEEALIGPSLPPIDGHAARHGMGQSAEPDVPPIPIVNAAALAASPAEPID